MENKVFENAKQLVNEHEELTSFCNSLELNSDNKVGIIHTWSDSPGVNYTTYSDNLKELLIKVVRERIKEIEKTFN